MPVTVLATVFLLCALPANSLFDTGFQTFLATNYGSTLAKQLIRSDLGVNGSFGGNTLSSPLKIYRDPLILVHGLNNNASSLIIIRDFFNRQGYGISEIYATSYGPNKTTVDASSKLECSYVKQIRQLIIAVLKYTSKARVNVVGYSIGATIARKAILGGICIDTKENLGTPLTNQVGTFLSVAGANLGTAECQAFPNVSICNALNGLKKDSAFLKDINAKKGYEGVYRYSIGSREDEIVGFANLSLASAQINVTLRNYAHGDTLMNTMNIQYSLLTRGFVGQRTIDKDAFAETQVSGRNCSGTVVGGENFQTGPHISQLTSNTDTNSFPGDYNQRAKAFMFLNGYNYTKHTDPTKGKFFSFRSKPVAG